MSETTIVEKPVSLEQIQAIAKQGFGDMVKVVVDVEKRMMGVGGEMHADIEAILLDRGSKQIDLWGINIWIDQPRESWVEFDSVINLRPSHGNRSRGVDDKQKQNRILEIVNSLIE